MIIIISGHGTVETAVSAIRKGAYDYIVKPFPKAEKLTGHGVSARFGNAVQLRQENAGFEGAFGRCEDIFDWPFISSLIVQLRQKIDKIAPTNSRVLISPDQAGAGKELIARLTARSNRIDAKRAI